MTEARRTAERRRPRRPDPQRHADEAAAKLRRRGEEQTGVSGWVARRAGEWSLDGPDWTFSSAARGRCSQGPRATGDPRRRADRAPATVGGADAMPLVASGRRIARALSLDKVARLKVFPGLPLAAGPW